MKSCTHTISEPLSLKLRLFKKNKMAALTTTHQAASEVVAVEMMLQKAGESKEGQAVLLEAELDRLRGPHAGAQLARGTDGNGRSITSQRLGDNRMINILSSGSLFVSTAREKNKVAISRKVLRNSP